MFKLVAPLLAMLCALALAGCETSLPSPDYSRDYVTVTDPQGRQMLVPEACLGVPQVESELAETMKLAPGCANSFNLLQMVERRDDVQRGRLMGPTMAAPVGRAAQYYLEGAEAQEKRTRRKEQESQGDTGGAQ